VVALYNCKDTFSCRLKYCISLHGCTNKHVKMIFSPIVLRAILDNITFRRLIIFKTCTLITLCGFRYDSILLTILREIIDIFVLYINYFLRKKIDIIE